MLEIYIPLAGEAVGTFVPSSMTRGTHGRVGTFGPPEGSDGPAHPPAFSPRIRWRKEFGTGGPTVSEVPQGEISISRLATAIFSALALMFAFGALVVSSRHQS